MSLATRLRPTTFDQVVGQGLTPIVLQAMVEQDKVPDGLFFSGPSGTGKTTCARIIASELDAELLEVDAATHGSVAELRSLLEMLKFGSTQRVVILDEVHTISSAGFDALLKTLEEPPLNTTFVLATTEPARVPETVKTRLREFEFRRVSIDALVGLLQSAVASEGVFFAQDALLEAIAQEAKGSPRRALTLYEQCVLAGVEDVERFYELQGIEDYAPILIAAMATGNSAETQSTLTKLLRRASTPRAIVSSLISTFCDLQVLRAGGTPDVDGHALDVRKQLSGVIPPEQTFNALAALWTYQQSMSSSEDPATDLRLACAIIENQIARRT